MNSCYKNDQLHILACVVAKEDCPITLVKGTTVLYNYNSDKKQVYHIQNIKLGKIKDQFL